jgi:hypothetical protein
MKAGMFVRLDTDQLDCSNVDLKNQMLRRADDRLKTNLSQPTNRHYYKQQVDDR